MKKFLLSPLWSLLTLTLVSWIYYANTALVESIKLRYFDQLIVNQPPVENNIYTVNIDEAAIAERGQWPWPRGQYAEIIADIYNRGAGLVVFMVLMPDEDRSGEDAVLIETLELYPVILNMLGDTVSRNEPINPGATIVGPQYMDLIVNYPGIIANIPDIEAYALGSGIVNTLPEIDGVTRRVPLVIASNSELYPNVTMEVLRVLAGDPSFQIRLNEFGVDKLRIPQFGEIPTDGVGRVWIDWSQTSMNYSVTDMPEDFAGGIVFVTPTAPGIANPVATALGPVNPHQLQAAMLGTVFNNSNIQRPAWAPGAETLVVVLGGLLLIVLARWTYVGLAFTVLLLAGLATGSWYVFTTHNLLLDGALTTAALVTVALIRYAVKFISEFLQKQQIKKQFGGYVSPHIVNQLAKDPSIVERGVKKNISITMTDLRGFTPLGESYGDDVEGLRQIMNDYMDAITQPVLKNEGTIIKYIGDASLHINGAPFDQVNHECVAVQTAIEMIDAVEKFNQELVDKGKPPVGMGAGINTGPTVIGNIGSKKRYGYDVLGDSVSTAARLEGQTKAYGVLLILGPDTARAARHHYHVVELDLLAVKGKSKALDIYTVIWREHPSTEFWVEHEAFLKSYRSADWRSANKHADWLIDNGPTTLVNYYKMMKDRIDELATQNIQNFDGVYRATSK